MPELWSWVDAAGVAWSLSGFANDAEVLTGQKGAGAPKSRRSRDTFAGTAGSLLLDIQDDLRTVDLPVLFRGADIDQVLRDWTTRLDPTRGDGVLIRSKDGASRELQCRCVEGLEGDESDGVSYVGAQKVVLVFEADDSYWYDIEAQSLRWVPPSVQVPWFSPGVKGILPILLGATNLFGTTSLTVAGDVDTWPVWVIDGPGSDLILRNDVDVFEWAGSIAEGDQLTIDTHPGVGTVTFSDTSSAFALLTAHDLWPLRPGVNDLSVELSGTGASSAITAQWRNRYRHK